MVTTTVPYLARARDTNGALLGTVTMRSGIGYSIPSPVIQQWLMSHHIEPTAGVGSVIVQYGTRPDAERSFATGHLIQTMAGVL